MSSQPPTSRPFARRTRAVLLFVGALLFLFEEWLWVVFTSLFRSLGRLGIFRWLDRWLATAGPTMALVLLCLPIALLFPVKIAGLWMIGSGRFLTGCIVMLVAKVVSTAIVARIFLTCRPTLMRMPWFARCYNVVFALRDRIHAWLAQQPAWMQAKRFVGSMRRFFRRGRRGAGGAGFRVRNGVLRRWRRTRRRNIVVATVRPVDGDRR